MTAILSRHPETFHFGLLDMIVSPLRFWLDARQRLDTKTINIAVAVARSRPQSHHSPQ